MKFSTKSSKSMAQARMYKRDLLAELKRDILEPTLSVNVSKLQEAPLYCILAYSMTIILSTSSLWMPLQG
ncbi:hypothetical protein PoB_001019400 [Plakobranchus ocellatus]|uniref:Uncharacterized protein n=1 Tax=Plakobranchus ocellatus TaxID=259542 RepID=A0AAV3YNJ7_9GAST|nr:hypothetical protein PoB_001019400 [Plakobranchus ocellatus]